MLSNLHVYRAVLSTSIKLAEGWLKMMLVMPAIHILLLVQSCQVKEETRDEASEWTESKEVI
jgi:hypothetical protein